MVDIAKTLNKLGITEWVLNGEPTNESEFNKMFRKVTGADDNGSAIESNNPNDFGVTWSQIQAKQTELQAEYEANQYQRDRAVAYPSIQDQLDMQYHDAVDGTTTWKDSIAKVKADNPKPE